MTISKWRISRGFSAGAAFVFAVILAATALTIQAVSPISVSHTSQTAAIAQVAASGAPAPAPTKPCNRPGFDILFNNPKDGSVPQEFYWPVCPIDAKMQHSASTNKYGWWSVGVYIKDTSNTTPPKGFTFNWGNGDAWGGAGGVPGDARCTWQNNGADNQVYIPAKGKTWECDVLHCEYTTAGVSGGLFKSSGDVAYTVPHDAITACTDLGRKNNAPTPPTVPTPNPTTGQGNTGKPAPTSETPPADEVTPSVDCKDDLLCKAAQAQKITGDYTLDDVLAEHTADKSVISQQCQGAAAKDDEGCVELIDRAKNTEAALRQIAADNTATIKNCEGVSSDKCDKARADNVKINDALKTDTTGPSSESGAPCPPGTSKDPTGNCLPNNDGPKPPNGAPYPDQKGRPDNSAHGQGGTQQPNNFGNPGLGANNTPPSPFGGACQTGYICSGSTLYWQTAQSSGTYNNGSGSCTTQPVQQCPYGCQQPYGATGQQGQQQSGLGSIAQYIPLITSVMGMFGGGNNSSAVNPNQSRACATQPQNQNGTGNDGQPCQQPPQQQPDPSQCTTGQWKQTTQQNGCPIGWQCVPGNGGGSGSPTAQLSCQPKIADVGMPISFSFSCGNSNGSAGTGFDTGGALSGSATSSAPTPPAGQNTATYTLTCINLGVTASARCDVQLGKPGIVLVTNPKSVVGGDTSLIGWITSGMQSCVVSSPDQADFTARNANSTSVNGAATTSPIVMTSRFQLDCTTLGGDTKQATTTVSIAP